MKLTSPALLVLSLAFGVASAARLQASSSREKLSIVMNGPADHSSTSQARPHDAHPHDAGRALKEETALTTAIDDGTVATCGQCEDPGEGAEGAIDVSEVVMVDVETPSEPTFAPSVGGTTVEPTAAPTVPLCGQCKNADDCLPAYACVSATASGCFNFDVAGDDKLYCVPASTTDGPTVAVTEETTTAGPTVAPTVAGTTAEPTVAPTVAGTTAEPTAAPTLTSTDSATTLEPTPPPTYATIRWIGGDPSITLQACEGDCDDDDDCEGNLVCMQRSGDEPIPGCGGDTSPRSEADYCVRPAEPELVDAEEFDVTGDNVIAAIETMPTSKATAVGCVATAAALGMAATMLLLMLGHV